MDFHEYVANRRQPLLRLAYLLAGDTHLAEDVVQTALLQAFRRRGRPRCSRSALWPDGASSRSPATPSRSRRTPRRPRSSCGEFFNCVGNPETAVTVELDEPLGDRELRDGLWYPPRPVLPDPAVEP